MSNGIKIKINSIKAKIIPWEKDKILFIKVLLFKPSVDQLFLISQRKLNHAGIKKINNKNVNIVPIKDKASLLTFKNKNDCESIQPNK